jgi:ketosteroid isomerase-like protein
MSQENAEIVRSMWEAWERRDLAAVFEFYDPAVEWDMTHSDVPDMRVYHGHDGVREFFRAWWAFFAEYSAVPEAFIAADENVVVRVRQGGRGRASTADIEMPGYFDMPRSWVVYRLRAGRAVRVEVYRDEAEALGAAGVRE